MTVRREFETPGNVALRVGIGAGSVLVEAAADLAVTEVEISPLRDDEVTLAAIAELRLEAVSRPDGHEIVVELPRRRWGWLGRGPAVAVRVRCPEGADLDAATSSADVESRGRLGAVRVRTASGDVRLVDAVSVDAGTASGDVVVDGEVSGGAAVKSASGDLRIRSVEGGLSANVVSGDVWVGGLVGDTTVASVSGDVRLEALGVGDVRVQAVSGEVHVGVRPGLELWLDVSSVSGTVASTLDLDHDEPQSGAQGLLHVRTVSGDVEIGRAVSARA